MDSNKEKAVESFGHLIDVLNELREKCPWDKKQTVESLRQLTIEETFELSDAILSKEVAEIKKELGDILLHIVFYARIATEKEWFTLNDIIETLIKKLKHRHPHIYGDVEAKDSKTVEENWEKIKLGEKDRKKRVLSGVPSGLPPMIKAFRIQQKARGVGFDWEYREQVWDKVQEELNELTYEINNPENNTEKIESEFGDLIFAMINAGRLYGIDPEKALEITNRKFIQRFNYLEEQTLLKGKDLHNMTLDEMEAIWQEAKKIENKE
ncbi:MAG TPA: nucleoside triphosphate pyrophosphohydrolase [Salinivirgaceae bacterium]|nr:nucleoside triphosphate pyrophosphohydrolase [Salinivirgaceae bacterium]